MQTIGLHSDSINEIIQKKTLVGMSAQPNSTNSTTSTSLKSNDPSSDALKSTWPLGSWKNLQCAGMSKAVSRMGSDDGYALL